LTLLEPENGSARSRTLPFEEYIEGLSPDGRYLLLQNSLSFVRRVVDTSDFSNVLRLDENQQWLSAPWSPHGNRLVLIANGEPTLFGLDEDADTALAGLPEAITREVVWSPDGERFALVSMLSNSGYGLNLYDSDGQPLVEPIVSPAVPAALPAFGR